jgi:3-deoxy-manno-octulosonate cytidylyltransferase (CMP-KDO synthetase)
MRVSLIIPARYASTRYPGKPLATLQTKNGAQSLIQLSWKAALTVAGVDEVFIATDDQRIKEVAEAFGAKVIMTSETCRNGTERCAEAYAVAGLTSEIIINFQGDAPLTPHWFVENLIAAMKADTSIKVATPMLSLDQDSYNMFCEDRREGRVGGTTVVRSNAGNALYFSKEVLPYRDLKYRPDLEWFPCYHHVGVYSYRPSALAAYVNTAESDLEKLEGLEQLRFLANEQLIKCVEVDAKGRVFWELNNPEDVPRIEKVLINA